MGRSNFVEKKPSSGGSYATNEKRSFPEAKQRKQRVEVPLKQRADKSYEPALRPERALMDKGFTREAAEEAAQSMAGGALGSAIKSYKGPKEMIVHKGPKMKGRSYPSIERKVKEPNPLMKKVIEAHKQSRLHNYTHGRGFVRSDGDKKPPLKELGDGGYSISKVREPKPTDSRGKVKVEDASALARAGQMKMRKLRKDIEPVKVTGTMRHFKKLEPIKRKYKSPAPTVEEGEE